ncbi:MAG TPA: YitT family protein [Tissierellales bacterium]|nr:YitT family protein [Tissierellales bacterium]
MNKKIKEYLLITIGMVMVAAGMYFFLMPNNLAVGGANGIAVVLHYFIPSMSVGFLMILINILLFIIGFIFIGANFGIKTIYASLGVSGSVLLLEKVVPMTGPISEDLLIQLFFGILISAIGMGIVFNQNASTGGTDIIAKILNKFLGIELGKGVLFSDLFIILMAGFAFGPELGMYSLFGVIINGFLVDATIEGLNIYKEVNIVSDYNNDIKDYIVTNLERGATLYEAKGAFTDSKKEVLVTVVDRKDFIRLKNFIKDVDGNAFITVNHVNEVLGDGFKNIQD